MYSVHIRCTHTAYIHNGGWTMGFSTQGLARASARRPWVTLGLWLVVIAIAGWLSSTYLSDALTTDANFTNDPEAKRATELIEERFGEEGLSEVFILTSDNATVDDPAFEEAVRGLQAAAVEQGAQGAATFYDAQDPTMVSDDRRTTLMPVQFADVRDTTEHIPAIDAILARADESGVVSGQSFGQISLNEDFSTIAEEDLVRGESIGIGVALVVLVLVFGAVVAGVVPIAMAIGSIAVSMGLVALVGRTVDFSFFVTNMITMMGLAVGIDYSLFIVSRYREERAKGRDKIDAIVAAGGTASRAVFFSGMTVVLALVGMLIIPTTIFRSLGAGAIFVVVASVLASLTLLPALLALLGDRVNSVRVLRRKSELGSEQSHRFWNAITRRVMGRPVVSLVIGAGLLVAASLSYFDINTGFSGVSTLPEDTRSRQGFEVLAAEFSGGLNSPVEIVVDGDVAAPEFQSAIQNLQASLESDGVFGPSQVRTSDSGDTAIVSAPVKADPSGEV